MKTKDLFASTFHRDNTVTFWNVYSQTWNRKSVYQIVNMHDVFASLSQTDRDKINKKLNF